MPAPTYNDYLSLPASAGTPVIAAEVTPQLDPAFETAWQQVRFRVSGEEGDLAFKMWAADLAYRYKTGGTFVPAISGISPTTGVHAVAIAALTITGTNFSAGAVVNFNGQDLPVPATNTTTSIVVPIPANLIPIAGTYGVKVRNTDGSITAATNFTAT